MRLYRDYSLADICFCGLLTVGAALASFRPSARAIVCEEISGQPELLRDLAEAGLNPENCEEWFEHAVLGFVAITAILLVVRVSLTIPAVRLRLVSDVTPFGLFRSRRPFNLDCTDLGRTMTNYIVRWKIKTAAIHFYCVEFLQAALAPANIWSH